MILLASIFAVQAAASAPATFCIEGRCRPVTEMPSTITSLDTSRNFVWISSDLRRVITGMILPGATTLVLPDQSQHHRFLPRLSDGATKATLDLELQCQDLVWKWSVTRVPAQDVDLRHPGSGCTLLIKSNGYGRVKRELPKNVDLGSIFLPKLPILSGTVTDADTATPLREAEVLLPNDDLLASTDRKGTFRAAVTAAWPSLIHVVMPGYARQTILLPKVAADTSLAIRLSKGGSLTIRLAEPLGHEDVSWEVRRLLEGSHTELSRSGRLPAGQTKTVVEALEPGRYLVTISGASPLQRAVALVTLTEHGNSEAPIEIFPARLEVTVTRNDQPVAGAAIQVRPDNRAWTSSITTDNDGKVTEEIWQKGQYTTLVTQLPLIPFWRSDQRIDSEKNFWDIRVPTRRLVGRVIDDSTEQGIPDARIFLTMKNEQTATSVALQSGAGGNFELGVCPSGTFTLAASKTGYEKAETSWSVDEAETEHVSEVRLKPTGSRMLAVTNALGAPLPGAIAYVTTRKGTRMAGSTDEEGHLSLPVRADEYGTIFVVPRSGSFGVARFDSLAQGSDSVLVQVPDGNATLEIQCETTSGVSLSGVAILLRFDGVLIPIQVREEMVNLQGSPMVSDGRGRLIMAHLPAGRYEVWPMSREQLVAVASNSPPPAPVSVVLTPGYQSARLVFASAKP